MVRRVLWAAALALVLSGSGPLWAQAQEDGGVSFDNHGQELLESLTVPPVKGAPFSLQLSTEWVKPMNNGGTFTLVNSRPIKRDSAGRVYEERWLLVPKGSRVVSRMSWIQIADPVTKTLLECSERQHKCALENWRGWNQPAAHPELRQSGALAGGHGTLVHEDLGGQRVDGLPVHEYRDTVTLDPGVMGNDLPLVTVRDVRFSAELGINLTSTLDTPQSGRQVFTVAEIATGEPDPKWFQAPAGYEVIDMRGAGQGRP